MTPLHALMACMRSWVLGMGAGCRWGSHGVCVFVCMRVCMRVCVQPNINLMTTGGGSVRFNPNLYNCGKVCLSLLGTWSGSSEERWNKDSTLLQLFVSIQALIFVKEPYFNEPGVESSMGSASAAHQSRTSTNGGWEPLRVATVRFAMIDMIKNPPAGFEDVVLLHFLHKRRSILDTMARWQAEAEGTADQLRAEVSTCRLLGVVGSP